MNTATKDESPEATTSGDSPITTPSHDTEIGDTIMSHHTDNPHPVDSTYHPCCGSIGGHSSACPGARAAMFADSPLSVGVDSDHQHIFVTDANHVEVGLLTRGQALKFAYALIAAADRIAPAAHYSREW